MAETSPPTVLRERRWPRQELSELRVHSGADHEPARLVLVRAIGGAEEILRGSRSQIKEVEGHLRDALRLSL